VPYALFLIGDNYRKNNEIDNGIQYYQQVINYHGCPVELLDAAVFIVVKTFYEQGKYDAIVSNFHYIIDRIPEHRSEMNPYTHFLMAEAYYYLGLYTEANKNYDNVISTYPFGVPSSFSREGRAWSLFQLEDYKGAMKQRELLRDDWMVTHSEAARISNEFETGDIYFNQKKYTEALDVFERYIADNPAGDKVAEATFNAGRCYYKLAYYSKAIELWDRLVANYKGTDYAKEAQSLIADTYFRMQKYDEAKQASLNIIADYPGTELADKAQLRIAQCCYNAQDDKQAITEFEKSLASSKVEETRDAAFEGILASAYRLSDADPDSDYDIKVLERDIAAYPASKQAAAMQYRVAERYYDKKDYARAADEFRKVVSEFASSDKAADAMFYCAESLYHDTKYEEAAAAYARFIESYPKNDSLRIGYLHMANSLFYLEKFKEASEKYRELTALGNQEDEIVLTAYFNASLCYKKYDNWDSVISINQQFVKRFPNNPRAKDALVEIANAYETLSNFPKAVQAYQDLYKVLPATDTMKTEAQYKIAKFYLKIGDDKSVKMAWQEFPKLLDLQPPDDPWRLSGIAQLAQEYENRKDWTNALKMYQEILNSTKEPKWVSAAQDRVEVINKELKESQDAKTTAK
jgi:TolA-binding protein